MGRLCAGRGSAGGVGRAVCGLCGVAAEVDGRGGTEKQAEYWKKNLEGAPELLELPTDRVRPAQQDYAGGALPVMLNDKLTEGLRELSARHGTTLYMTLLAGWRCWWEMSGQQDVVIGTPVQSRRVEIENLIGFFVNMLVVRVDMSGRPTVGEMLARVKRQAIAAQQHQDIPFEQVVELVQPVRSLAHSPYSSDVWLAGCERRTDPNCRLGDRGCWSRRRMWFRNSI